MGPLIPRSPLSSLKYFSSVRGLGQLIKPRKAAGRYHWTINFYFTLARDPFLVSLSVPVLISESKHIHAIIIIIISLKEEKKNNHQIHKVWVLDS